MKSNVIEYAVHPIDLAVAHSRELYTQLLYLAVVGRCLRGLLGLFQLRSQEADGFLVGLLDASVLLHGRLSLPESQTGYFVSASRSDITPICSRMVVVS